MQIPYRPEIDGIRALAVSMVIIYHLNITIGDVHLLTGGFLGVDVFFVISGFLITSLLKQELQVTGRLNILRFYERRARRLLPGLFTVMLASLPFSWLILTPSALVEFSSSLISSMGFVSNLFWWVVDDQYGATSSLMQPFLHTWSLAVEEQFYLVFPLFFYWLSKKSPTRAGLVLSCLAILGLILSEALLVLSPSATFFLLPTRVWELLVGSSIAILILEKKIQAIPTRLNTPLQVLALVLLIGSAAVVDLGTHHPGLTTLPSIAATLILLLPTNSRPIVHRFFSITLLQIVGKASYSLYLWHYPVFAFGRMLSPEPTVLEQLLWIATATLLSLPSYHFIEKPFRDGKRTTKRFLLVSLTVAATVILTYSLYTILSGGIETRLENKRVLFGPNEPDNKKLQAATWMPLNELAKAHGFGPSQPSEPSEFEKSSLWFSQSPDTIKILIVGNSHSKDLFNAFYLNSSLFQGLEFARYGIQITPETKKLTDLTNSPNFRSADIILISTRFPEAVIPYVAGFIKELDKRDKLIVLCGPSLEFTSYKGNENLFDGYLEESKDKASVAAVNKLFFEHRDLSVIDRNKRLQAIALSMHIPFLDKAAYQSDTSLQICYGVTDEGLKCFYDGTHYTVAGAIYFGKKIHTVSWLAPVLSFTRKKID